jgi:plastocyanin
MIKRSIALAAVSLLILLPMGLAPAFAADKEVVVLLGSLREAHITVNRGDHVTWRNASGEKAHLAFVQDPGATHPEVWIEGMVTLNFDRPGTYEYHVHQPHAKILHGRVTVR